MHEFHRGPYETAVGPAEMLVEIRVPLHANSGSAYLKVDRRVGDWAVVAAGAALTLERRRDHPARASRSPRSAATSRPTPPKRRSIGAAAHRRDLRAGGARSRSPHANP